MTRSWTLLLLAAGWTAFPAGAAATCLPDGFDHHIVVDQFGYQPAMLKIAVIRSPITGFDADQVFSPSNRYQVVDVDTCRAVFEGPLVTWNGGREDPASGDKVWHFDFSPLTKPGHYIIRDKERGAASGVFEISSNPYRQVLVQAVRYFYYQRAGTPKLAAHAGPEWTAAADHLGPHQDGEARYVFARDNASTARDLRGGWWDAGDYNRYTNWHCDYIISLLTAYSENPAAFTDDFNIPESGNGVPDLIDEVKWGLDWLIRMQNADGSVLSILSAGQSGAPPSSATNPSYYGPATASATYSSAAGFAIGAKVLGQFPAYRAYAKDLAARARRAWEWAEAHPDATFFNKAPPFDVEQFGGGEQEYGPAERPTRALIAAVHLFDLTADAHYEERLGELIPATPLVARDQLAPSDGAWVQPLLFYAHLPNARGDLATMVRNHFTDAFRSGIYAGEVGGRSAYNAYLPAYYWGSNREAARTGFFFLSGGPQDASAYAANYLHYIHGVNPLAKVYLSNMGKYGAENSVVSFFHAWFATGTPWSSVKDSQYGPPPGYLVGGANPSYSWAKGCPNLNPACGKAPPSPPFAQPPLKSYADINDSWPIDSWEVSEPSNGYQVEYIRLLSRFVSP